MLAKLRSRLTYANVMATIAVFLALGGGAYAAATIGSKDIKRDAVLSRHIRAGNVKASDLSAGAVTSPKIARGAVGPTKLGRIPAAHVTRTGDQSIPHNTNTPIALDSERYDTAAMHSNAVNNSRLTVPVTGVYNVTFAVTWLANATGIRDIALKRNGTIVIADDFNNAPSADGAQEVTTQVRLRAGEFVVGEVLQSSGGPLPISKLEAHSPELSMTWLAPG